jgi:hydrogenase maturation protein HypF
LNIPWSQPEPVLAVGGHMKGTVALSWGRRVVVSPHIGEMDSPRSLDVFEQVASDLQDLYGVSAKRIVCDAHPGYTTHRWAHRQKLPVETVWHHDAHASAVTAELGLQGNWLVFAWDGVGLGRDGTLWGGEALLGRPGPWRSAAALHWECARDWKATSDADGVAKAAWDTDLNCPKTSAAGRLFDAAAAMVCDLPVASFEAQGPMMLEALCSMPVDAIELPLIDCGDGVLRTNWEPMLDMLGDASMEPELRAETFHASVANAILRQAEAARAQHEFAQVGLCGGVFQNRFLAEQTMTLLRKAGFDVYLPRLLPGNDASLSYGQAAELAAREAE